MPFSSSENDAKIETQMSQTLAVILSHKLQRLKLKRSLRGLSLNIIRNRKSSVFPSFHVKICFSVDQKCMEMIQNFTTFCGYETTRKLN